VEYDSDNQGHMRPQVPPAKTHRGFLIGGIATLVVGALFLFLGAIFISGALAYVDKGGEPNPELLRTATADVTLVSGEYQNWEVCADDNGRNRCQEVTGYLCTLDYSFTAEGRAIQMEADAPESSTIPCEDAYPEGSQVEVYYQEGYPSNFTPREPSTILQTGEAGVLLGFGALFALVGIGIGSVGVFLLRRVKQPAALAS